MTASVVIISQPVANSADKIASCVDRQDHAGDDALFGAGHFDRLESDPSHNADKGVSRLDLDPLTKEALDRDRFSPASCGDSVAIVSHLQFLSSGAA